MAGLIGALHRHERRSFTRAFQAHPLSGADRLIYPWITAVILLRTAVNVSFALARLSMGDARSAAVISEFTLGTLFLAWLALPALLRAASPADARLDAERLLLFPLRPAVRVARDVLAVLAQPILWILAAATAGAILPALFGPRPVPAAAAVLLLLASCVLVFRGLDALGGRTGPAASIRSALGALLRTFPVILTVLNPEFRIEPLGVSAVVFFTVRVPLTRPDGSGLIDVLGPFSPPSWAVRAAAVDGLPWILPLAALAAVGAILTWRSAASGQSMRSHAVRTASGKRSAGPPRPRWPIPNLPPLLRAELAAALRRPESAFTFLAGAGLAVYCLFSALVPESLPAGSAAAVTLLAAGAAFRPIAPERRLRYLLLPIGPGDEARARTVSWAAPGLASCLPVLAADAALFGPVHGAALLGAVLSVLALCAACGTLAQSALEEREEPAHGSRGPGARTMEQETGGGAGVAIAAALWAIPYLLSKKLAANPAALAAALLGLAAMAAAAYAFVERGLERGRPR